MNMALLWLIGIPVVIALLILIIYFIVKASS